MPTVSYRDAEIPCEHGALLRDVLQDAGYSVYNGRSERFNRRGVGSCGTCAVAVEGPVSDPTRRERLRLHVPPHDPENGLRLACQTRVEGDVTVTKGSGFWGQRP